MGNASLALGPTYGACTHGPSNVHPIRTRCVLRCKAGMGSSLHTTCGGRQDRWVEHSNERKVSHKTQSIRRYVNVTEQSSWSVVI